MKNMLLLPAHRAIVSALRANVGPVTLEGIMKKSLMVAGALAAMALTGNALAINVGVQRTLRVPGLTALPGAPSVDSLGSMTLTALGQQGGYCTYLMDWQSPKNENDVLQCIIKERRTAVNPSCIANKGADITSTLEAGPAAPGGATFCAGFDNLGVSFPA